MKQVLFLIALLMNFSSSLLAHGPETSCRQYVVRGDFASQKARMAADLTSSTWSLQTNRLENASGQMIFHDFGVADEIITYADGKMAYERINWTIEEYNGAVFLVVTHVQKQKQTNLYRLTPTCAGIDLTDAASQERIQLLYTGTKLAAVRNMAQYLTGAWTADAYPFDIAQTMDDCGTFEPIHGAFLQYAFWDNGTFVKEWGNAGVSYREAGYWDITADGEYLLMHVNNQNNQEVQRTDVARISQMGHGTVQIEQALVDGHQNDQFCTGVKTFSLTRWAPKV
jgi:hypothetical protein